MQAWVSGIAIISSMFAELIAIVYRDPLLAGHLVFHGFFSRIIKGFRECTVTFIAFPELTVGMQWWMSSRYDWENVFIWIWLPFFYGSRGLRWWIVKINCFLHGARSIRLSWGCWRSCSFSEEITFHMRVDISRNWWNLLIWWIEKQWKEHNKYCIDLIFSNWVRIQLSVSEIMKFGYVG